MGGNRVQPPSLRPPAPSCGAPIEAEVSISRSSVIGRGIKPGAGPGRKGRGLVYDAVLHAGENAPGIFAMAACRHSPLRFPPSANQQSQVRHAASERLRCRLPVAWMSSVAESCTILIKAIPNAPRGRIVGWLGDGLKVKVHAPPVEGRANEVLCEFLAESPGLSRRAVTLVRGGTSRQKVVRIDGFSLAAVREPAWRLKFWIQSACRRTAATEAELERGRVCRGRREQEAGFSKPGRAPIPRKQYGRPFDAGLALDAMPQSSFRKEARRQAAALHSIESVPFRCSIFSATHDPREPAQTRQPRKAAANARPAAIADQMATGPKAQRIPKA
ncbi:MAG: DUF167 domain-containing protein [Marinilabiliales bacterium]|nr:DUF167 domain-containing protein [Marinilabiliales bacterium]